MDRAYSAGDVFEHSNLRWFNDAAAKCAETCIQSYDSKELNAPERKCVNTCFKKQMVVMAGVQSIFAGKKW